MHFNWLKIESADWNC